MLLVLSTSYKSIYPAPLLCKRAACKNSPYRVYCLCYSRVTSYPRSLYRVALLSSVTLTLSTMTTYTILMQILAIVQRSVLSNQFKLQLNLSVGMDRDRYLEVQSTQGGCDEIY
jgi:hypothetical protein